MPDFPVPFPTLSTSLRVRAVIPCHAPSPDLDRLLADLAITDLGDTDTAGLRLEVFVVDNGATPPLAIHAPPGVRLRVIRLDSNRGGSGGFNAGMRAALEDPATDFLWLLDSDARIEPNTLRLMVDALLDHPEAWAIGPAIATDPSQPPHEIGGRIDRRRGTLGAAFRSHDAPTAPTEVDYVASCCLLARARTVSAHGLMPDVFLNGDDAQWCVTVSRLAGLRVLAHPSARAYHPSFHRPPTWQRFYQSRNAFGPVAALGLPRTVAWKRAMVEVFRAVNQVLIGRRDLARLHLNGLAAAVAGHRSGPGPHAQTHVEPARPLEELRSAARDLSDGAPRLGAPSPLLARLLLGPRRGWTEIDLKGGPSAWLAAQTTIVRDANRGVLVRHRWPRVLFHAATTMLEGTRLAFSLLASPPGEHPLTPAYNQADPEHHAATRFTRTPSLSIVVLSFNRREALRQTLVELASDPTTARAEVLVVDNASSDGSVHMVSSDFPRVRLLVQPGNIGVAGFNRGVSEATGEVVLILDDDARPDPASLLEALRWMAHHPYGAVALLPRHPRTGASEWPFAGAPRGGENPPPADTRWPVMGSGNLVRRDDWLAVGGYEERFFLYRNDTDLAMKLLAAGRSVAFSPSWIVWHDSPATRSKSRRWCRLATRNWMFVARRHGRGLMKFLGGAAGWAWAHRLAGMRPRCQWEVLAGALEGLFTRPPPLPADVKPDGEHFARLVRLQVCSSSSGRGGTLPSTVRPTPRPVSPVLEEAAPKEPADPGGRDTPAESPAATPAKALSIARHSA